jgi:hypothetical protein
MQRPRKICQSKSDTAQDVRWWFAEKRDRQLVFICPRCFPKENQSFAHTISDDNYRTSASDIIKSSAASRGRKQSYNDVDLPHKRSPSVSSHSSADSIATISTNQSRSRSPPPRRSEPSRSHHGKDDQKRSRSRDRSHRDRSSLKPRNAGHEAFDREGSRAGSRRSRSPPRRHHRRSPSEERPRRREPQRSRSRSPYRQSSVAQDRGVAPSQQSRAPPVQRERSLSPFSKRQALTRAQQGGN